MNRRSWPRFSDSGPVAYKRALSPWPTRTRGSEAGVSRKGMSSQTRANFHNLIFHRFSVQNGNKLLGKKGGGQSGQNLKHASKVGCGVSAECGH